SKTFKAVAPAAPSSIAASVSIQTQASITMLVADVNNAAVEAEKILAEYGARKIIKQLLYGKTILKAELSAGNLKEVLAQLRNIGRIEEKNMPTESTDQDIPVVIEIINK